MEEKWQKIWCKAVRANSKMLRNKEKGEDSFLRLEKTYPNDAMVLLEWAFAYETLNEHDKAKEKFKAAKEKFFLEDWKQTAQYGIDRNSKENDFEIYNEDILAEVFYELHSYLYSPEEQELKYALLNAISRIKVESSSALILFRATLEMFMITIIHIKNLLKSDKLEEMINIVCNSTGANAEIREAMDNIRQAGNAKAHLKSATPKAKRLSNDINGRLKDFINVVKYCEFESISKIYELIFKGSM